MQHERTTNGLPPLRTRNVLDIPVAIIDYAGAIRYMDALIEQRIQGYVCAEPVHGVMVAQTDPEMDAALQGASLIVPDGMPLVWACNMLNERLQDRVYGPELMHRYLKHCAEVGHKIWLYGGRDHDALIQLATRIRGRYPGIRITGGYCPPYRGLTAEEETDVARIINESEPDVVWCGIGVPKQEKWMARMRDSVEAPVMIGVGAAFDFIGGQVSQAPRWMQERGLEWTYRIAQEPRRLLPRYLNYNPRFMAAFARQYARERVREEGRSTALGAGS